MMLNSLDGGGVVRCTIAVMILACVSASGLNAATMPIVSLFPENGSTNVCADTELRITFVTTPIVQTSGNLQIRKVSDGSLLWQLNLQSLTNPPVASGWPYQINLNGKTVNYQPFATSASTLEIHPAVRLGYNTEYYVTITAGFCRDSGSNTSPAITDNVTWRFMTKASAPAADYDYTVALDGTGDFCTLQGASDAVADNDPCRTIIMVKNGTYRELVNVGSSKKNVTWLGEDKDSTVVAAFNNANFNTAGSSYRCMVEVSASDFRMYNMTLRNTTPQGGSQAESIKVNGPQRFLTQNCKFYSYQDTLLVSGTAYFGDCYVEGDVDFIWGSGSVYFDACEIRNMRSGGYNVQPRNGNGVPGYFFVDCTLTSPGGITGVYLARDAGDSGGVPYYPYGQVVYISCKMSSSIASIGWRITADYDPAKLYFAEYHSMDLNGNLLNVSGRDPKSRQLNDADAAYWRTVTNVLGGWNPKALPDLPTAAWQPQPVDGAAGVDGGGVTLEWAAGAAATSHLVYFGTDYPPPYVVEQTGASLATGALTTGAVYNWRVSEKNAAGTTTGQVWSFTAVTDGIAPSPNPMTWAIVPNATGIDTIIMTATAATDASGVEYFFANITDPNHNSEWQDSASYTDTGLTNNTTYTYRVIARDKSAGQNETAWSQEAIATTIRYECSATLDMDFNADCKVDFMDYATIASTWGAATGGVTYLTNGEFATDISSWTLADLPGAGGIMTAVFDGTSGNPAGSALISANTTVYTNKHRFYQIVPVIVGKSYILSGQWSGNIVGLVTDPTGGTLRNWAEISVGFETSTIPADWSNTSTMYKKGYGIILLNTTTGIWGWEPFTSSPNTSPVPPAGGIFTATAPYMVVAFNVGGQAGSGSPYIHADNISVVEPCPEMDLNDDCAFDWLDIRVFASEWLDCNRNPGSECWQ